MRLLNLIALIFSSKITKLFLMLVLLLFSNRMMGQKDLPLNEMLLSCFNLYIENHKEYVKQGASASDTCHYYACKDGLPSNFPFEKLSNITFFSLQNINGLPSFLNLENQSQMPKTQVKKITNKFQSK